MPSTPARRFDDRAFHARLRMRHLALFRTLCDLASLRQAAEASNMTQPSATKLIQELESMLGTVLFVRDRRGMRPTPEGVLLRRHVDLVMADLSSMRADIDLYAMGGSGRIRLGIIPSLSSALLSGVVSRMIATRPRVRFEMREGATTELLDALGRNELDITFGRVLDHQRASGLRVVQVYTETFAIACRPGHPIAQRRRGGWRELGAAQWALPAAGTPLRELADSMFTRQGVLQPVVVVESSSFHQMRHLVAASDLLAVLPRSIAMQGVKAGDLALLKPRLSPEFAPISLLSRREVEETPLVAAFVKTVLQEAGRARAERWRTTDKVSASTATSKSRR